MALNPITVKIPAKMSKMLFRMRNVPDDESQEVRDLLDENNIDYFETFGGNWGISMPALWIKSAEQYSTARKLLDEYQQDRLQRVRSEYERDRDQGEVKTMWHIFQESPLKFIAFIGLAGLVLYLSLSLFLSL